jgi:hypothetical protein
VATREQGGQVDDLLNSPYGKDALTIVIWKQKCWCFDAAQRDLSAAAAFFLDEEIPLDD